MFNKVDQKQSFPKMEEEILKFWEGHKIFEKSVANREGAKKYGFYDGPPFATGLPHYGHIVTSIIKDVVPRYKTMRGYHVPRVWGWDCHGLPIENIVEKELGFKHKKDIQGLGIAKFNERCRDQVLTYVHEWEKVIPRIGRWVDMKNAYKTMDLDYMESVWWVFKELWDKGLIYESYRSMHICPRCETTLSQQEVAEGYEDVKDISVTAKFELLTPPQSSPWEGEETAPTYVLAWTTTPWTLPGNVALAVGKDIEYVKMRVAEKLKENETRTEIDNHFYIIVSKSYAEKLWSEHGSHSYIVAGPGEYEWELKGSDLVGKSYKPLFDYYSRQCDLLDDENGPPATLSRSECGQGWKIYAADFVTTEEGTGVVHIAPAFGEDDMELGKKEKLPFVQHVKMDGTMKPEVTDFAGMEVKPKGEDRVRLGTDIAILKYLQDHGTFFSKENITHSYPHCWRCDTPLLNYATSSWFVRVEKLRPELISTAKSISWFPSHMKEGLFGKWLEGARDWSISRQRFWASVIPIWKCDCGEMKVFGSVRELEEASGKKNITDLHKHFVDEITVPCEKCGETMRRIPDVLDTWFDSGSMPYGQAHYPFENKERFEQTFPAQFISEFTGQFRAWFYYLHVLSTVLFKTHAFDQVIAHGIVLAEDGKKMSKRLKNYPDPMTVVGKYGADSLRLYILSSPIVSAENLNFSERELTESTRNLFRMLWNSYSFFVTYANIDGWEPNSSVSRTQQLPPERGARERGKNLLDRWILSELQVLVGAVNESMEKYDLLKATRAFAPFVDNLSNWYLRRSRRRFSKSDDTDKASAYATLHHVLVELSKLMAPFTPFMAEEIYRNLTDEESVHLAEYPAEDYKLVDVELNVRMKEVRDIVSLGLQMRAQKGIRVRQPLGSIWISRVTWDCPELLEIIGEELNLKSVEVRGGNVTNFGKEIVVDKIGDIVLTLFCEITPELKLEGEAREIVRAVQDGRKKAGFEVNDRIVLGHVGMERVFENKEMKTMFVRELPTTEMRVGELADAEYTETVDLDGEAFTLWLKR